MSKRDEDNLGQVPLMVPERDEVASYQRKQKSKGKLSDSLGDVPDVKASTSSGGGSALSKGVLGLTVCGLLAALVWAGMLNQQLKGTEQVLASYELRISELEKRLMVTDESMAESSVAMQVKIRELDGEVRKLWDNVWKKTKEDFAAQQAQIKKQSDSLGKLNKQLTGLSTEVAEFGKQLEGTAGLAEKVAAGVNSVEAMNARVKSASEQAKSAASLTKQLEERVKANEEWLDSVNAFRRQVNRDISNLQQSLGQAPSSSPQ